MKRSDLNGMLANQKANIEEVEDIELIDALEKYGKNFLLPERAKLIQLGDKVYAPGKWTVKDILQHFIDTERIQSYRVLRFARNDKTLLPGFEENEYAATANASHRDLNELLEEFYTVRDSTTRLFKSFSDETLMKTGKLPSGDISVLAMGFAITGHAIHHIKVIKEKYYGLL